jgi:hypothetical protein
VDAAAGSAGGVPAPSGTKPWCPAHSSSPAPLALEVNEDTLFDCIDDVFRALPCDQRLPLMGCGYAGCLFEGCPNEAGLVNQRGVVCRGCGVLRFCCREHEAFAWPAHYRQCRRLAAALGRKVGSSGGGNINSNSQVKGGKPAAPPARGFFGPRAAVVQQGVASGGVSGSRSNTSSSSSTPGDTICVRDQERAPAERVCAWCGKAAPNLLRCGRCKAAWYCGADHQRAAWKAGHKQECGGGAAVAAAASPSHT